MTRLLAVAAALTAALAPAAALAHHGWDAYDAAKPVKITAPLTNISWSNPHGAAKVAYQGKSWTVLLAPIARMESRGLTRARLSAAKSVTLEGQARTDGVAELKLERITVDGETINLLR